LESLRMTSRLSSTPIVVSCLIAALGCSAGGSRGSTAAHGGGSGLVGNGSGGSGVSLNVNSGPVTGRDPSDTRDLPVRKKVCAADGSNCTCLRLGLLGTLESAAAKNDTQPFVDWLNANTDGTATVTRVSTKPTIDATFLASYDILLVANVNTWSFSDAEKAAVKTWSETTGGGIVSLTGFLSTPSEPAATSQLISFAGLAYAPPETSLGGPTGGQPVPVYYKGGSVNMKDCLSGRNNYDPLTTAPIRFTPQTGSMAKLTLGLDYVGAFDGWTVTAPAAGASVIATDPVTGGNMAVAYDTGKGRIFAYGDEWVILKNQWLPDGLPPNTQMDAGNHCWLPATAAAPGMLLTVQQIYQTKQFWYDAINWVAPPNECNFVVTDPDVIPVK
jgi:hypothetical protein